MTYPTPGDEWFAPIRTGYRFRCCDCRLVHRIDFRIVGKRRQLQMRVFRDNRATAASRRKAK